MTTWAWPAPGVTIITSGRGPRWGTQHNGIDIAGSNCHGKPAVASRAGTVIATCTSCTHDYGKSYSCGCGGGYGNYVFIDHGDGYTTRYGHASKVYVKVGQKVVQGQKILAIGSTGHSTGAHLHFEIRYNGNIKNPEDYVNPNKTVAIVDGGANALKDFISVARKHIGESGQWTWSTSGLGVGQPWCAAFVVACAKTAKILNKVIPLTYIAGGIPEIGVKQHMGKFIKGPMLGSISTPQPGDCVTFYQSGGKPSSIYSASHVGIVTDVSGNRFDTAEGNSTSYDNMTSKVGKHTYSTNCSYIMGYYRPDWTKVGGYIDGTTSSGTRGYLYDMVNTREDATIREAAYYNNNKQEPSIKSTNTKLAEINYTSLLSVIFGVSDTADITGSSDSVDFSGIGNNNAKIIGNYLVDKGLNAAMAVGFLANIYHESGYNPSAVNSGSGASGICQWLGGRFSAMVKVAGSNWRHNLTGQLNYLWSELTGSESNTLNLLKSGVTGNSEDMAATAADIVLRNFERPGNYSVNTPIRTKTARQIWKKIVINTAKSTKNANTGNSAADQVWNFLANKGFSDGVNAGIIGNMMRECGGDTLDLKWNMYGSYQGVKYYGLCMWSASYAPANLMGSSISFQLNYLMSTMKSQFDTYGYMYKQGFNYDKFRKLSDYEEAAVAFAICYERPGYEENRYGKRRNNARSAYNTYHK